MLIFEGCLFSRGAYFQGVHAYFHEVLINAIIFWQRAVVGTD